MRRIALAVALFTLSSCATGGAGPDAPDPQADVSQADVVAVRLLGQRIAATNAHDWQTWQALHTEDCVRTAPDLAAPLTSSAQMREAIARLGRAFPDYHVALLRVLGSGPWYAAELRSSGTMSNDLEVPGGLPIPAQHRRFRQHWMAFFRVEGGRIAEFHERYDQSSLVDQLTGKAAPHSWED